MTLCGRLTATLSAGILAASICTIAAADTIRVPDDAATIQLGIDAVSEGDTVLVAAGTYTGAGNREINFGGKEIVLIGEGGFAGTIIDCEGTPTSNARGFIFENQESFLALVTGFTIRGGHRSGTTWPVGFGGGMIIGDHGTEPTIRNCLFENNHAEASGGAIAVSDDAAPFFTDCIFQYNTTDQNGAGAFLSAPVTVTDCQFIGNVARSGRGGGAYCFSSNSPEIRDCVFRENEASGGGGVASRGASPQLIQCEFVKNVAGSHGGSGVYSEAGAHIRLTSCLFNDNSVDTTPGGTISCNAATAEMDGCTLHQNEAPSGSGVYLRSSSSIQIDNTIIVAGIDGEAVWCDETSTATLRCTDLFGNDGGDWVGCIVDQAGLDGNLSADPFFCQIGLADFHLAENSPCAPAQSGACGLIGRYDTSCSPHALRAATWGAVKLTFE